MSVWHAPYLEYRIWNKEKGIVHTSVELQPFKQKKMSAILTCMVSKIQLYCNFQIAYEYFCCSTTSQDSCSELHTQIQYGFRHKHILFECETDDENDHYIQWPITGRTGHIGIPGIA